MESIDLSQVMEIAITIIVAIMTRFVIPWLREITNERQYANIKTIVEILVRAAEQLFRGEEKKGSEKLAYVQAELEKRGLADNTPVIEAAVLELKNQLAQLNKT